MSEPCFVCGGREFGPTPYADTEFNGKVFRSVRCARCRLVQIDPLPDDNDTSAMYAPEYQDDLDPVLPDRVKAFVQAIRTHAGGTRVVDFGCGTGELADALARQGFSVTGVEFNPEHVAGLRARYPETVFMTADEFWRGSDRFDAVVLDNVLEHLAYPVDFLRRLCARLSADGVAVVRGPLEENANLAWLARGVVFGARKVIAPRNATHPPCHLYFTDRHNQLELFQHTKFATLSFSIDEQAWPFPGRLGEVRRPGDVSRMLLAQGSILCSHVVPGWGNRFFYVGRCPAPAETQGR